MSRAVRACRNTRNIQEKYKTEVYIYICIYIYMLIYTYIYIQNIHTIIGKHKKIQGGAAGGRAGAPPLIFSYVFLWFCIYVCICFEKQGNKKKCVPKHLPTISQKSSNSSQKPFKNLPKISETSPKHFLKIYQKSFKHLTNIPNKSPNNRPKISPKMSQKSPKHLPKMFPKSPKHVPNIF